MQEFDVYLTDCRMFVSEILLALAAFLQILIFLPKVSENNKA